MTAREELPLLGACVVAAHNLEEALTGPAWLREHSANAHILGLQVPLVPDRTAYVALALVTLFSWLWIGAACRSQPRSLGAYSVLALFGVYLGNAFVPHVVATLLLRAYVPGVITAVLGVIPFVLLFLSVGIRTGRYTRRGAGVTLALAFTAYAAAGLPARWLLRAGLAVSGAGGPAG